jgi:hypothetical protein
LYLKNEENVVLINGKTLENDEGIGKSCVASRASLLKKSNYSTISEASEYHLKRLSGQIRN